MERGAIAIQRRSTGVDGVSMRAPPAASSVRLAAGGAIARRMLREFTMKTFLFAACALAATASAFASEASDLRGTWTSADGAATVRIAACPTAADRLCAVVVADKPEPGERSAVGEIGMSGIVADGQDRWRGQYHNGDQKLPATLRMRGADRIDMRVCVGLFCSTDQYRRAR